MKKFEWYFGCDGHAHSFGMAEIGVLQILNLLDELAPINDHKEKDFNYKFERFDFFRQISLCFFIEYSIRIFANNRYPREVNVPSFNHGQIIN